MTTVIAIWAAVVSTTLAVIKIIEFYNDQLKFDVTTMMYNDRDNTITIANLYKYPITIFYFDLFLAIDPKKPIASIGVDIDSYTPIHVKSHETFTVCWNRPNLYFIENPNSPATYYIVMSILGRKKPLYLKVFNS